MKKITVIIGPVCEYRDDRARELVLGKDYSYVKGFELGVIENMITIQNPTIVWVNNAKANDLMLPKMLDPEMPNFLVCMTEDEDFAVPMIFESDIELIKLT